MKRLSLSCLLALTAALGWCGQPAPPPMAIIVTFAKPELAAKLDALTEKAVKNKFPCMISMAAGLKPGETTADLLRESHGLPSERIQKLTVFSIYARYMISYQAVESEGRTTIIGATVDRATAQTIFTSSLMIPATDTETALEDFVRSIVASLESGGPQCPEPKGGASQNGQHHSR